MTVTPLRPNHGDGLNTWPLNATKDKQQSTTRVAAAHVLRQIWCWRHGIEVDWGQGLRVESSGKSTTLLRHAVFTRFRFCQPFIVGLASFNTTEVLKIKFLGTKGRGRVWQIAA
jgi:hypothetical protein